MLRTDRAAGEDRRSRWLTRGLSLILTVAALAGVLSARGATNVASGTASNSSRLAGAFVNWGPDGRERTLEIWEQWLDQAPSSVVGVDFYAESTWQDFFRLNWVPGIWKRLNPKRNVVWSMPLTVKGTRLAEVASGVPFTVSGTDQTTFRAGLRFFQMPGTQLSRKKSCHVDSA